MASLTSYRGLQVITPNPAGAGGLALNDDLKYLADRSVVHEDTRDPGASDDGSDASEEDRYYVGSRWFNTTNNRLFVCIDNTTSNAQWIELNWTGAASEFLTSR